MSTSAKREQLPAPASADKTRLVEANVNPQTGFASDYLNHFSEAVMLLELMMEMPECREDFLAWQPRKYEEHFAASNFKHRDVAIAAYGEADPEFEADRLSRRAAWFDGHAQRKIQRRSSGVHSELSPVEK